MKARDQPGAGPCGPRPGSSFNLLSHTRIEAPRPYVIALWLVLALVFARLALLASVVYLGWGWFPAPAHLPSVLPGHPGSLFMAALGAIACAIICIDFTFGPGLMMVPDPPHGRSLPNYRSLGSGILGVAFIPALDFLMVLFSPFGEMPDFFWLLWDPGLIAPSLIVGAYQSYGVRHHTPVERRLSPAAVYLRFFVATFILSLVPTKIIFELVLLAARNFGIGIPFW